MIRRKYAVVTCQVHCGARHQPSQTGQEIQRLEDHMAGAFSLLNGHKLTGINRNGPRNHPKAH